MGSRPDLIGQRFGRLTVIQSAGSTPKGRAQWLCRCDCGNMTTVTTAHLRNGTTVSCGCVARDAGKNNVIDITGQRFGRLIVISRAPGRRGNSALWRCRCDCGGEIVTSGAALKSGQCRSCGCLASEAHREAFKTARKAREAAKVEGTDLALLNANLPAHNTSGVKGVSWDSSVKTWKAYIQFRGKRYYLGSSRDFDAAVWLRKQGEGRIWGDFLTWYNSQKPPSD